MSASMPAWLALLPAALIGVGLYGVLVQPQPLRKLLSFNVVGSGAFLLFGFVARRGATPEAYGDPVPQALLITGIVVAFCASALAVMLILRLHERSGDTSLDPPDAAEEPR